MDKLAILASLQSGICEGCGGAKVPMKSHCGKCYFKLPKGLRNSLYKRFGSGYEEAFLESLEVLKQSNQIRN